MKLFFRGIILIFSLLIIWQCVISIANLPSYILPSPKEVFITWYQQRWLILHESSYTIFAALAGLLLGTGIACFTALIMAFIQPLALWILPILIISQAIPTFAIAPLLVIWFGYGMLSKIITTIIMLFFPITSAFLDGLERTPTAWLDLASTLPAKKWRFLWLVRIPYALPYFASGMRIATVAAPIGAMVGEWVGASHGLGFLMLQANARMQIDVMFAALFTFIIFSLLLYFIVHHSLKKLIWW